MTEKIPKPNMVKIKGAVFTLVRNTLGGPAKDFGLNVILTTSEAKFKKEREGLSEKTLLIHVERKPGMYDGYFNDVITVSRANYTRSFVADGTAEEFFESLRAPEKDRDYFYVAAFIPAKCEDCGQATFAPLSPRTTIDDTVAHTYCPSCYNKKTGNI